MNHFDTIVAHERRLDKADQSPTGDDYNTLYESAMLAMQEFESAIDVLTELSDILDVVLIHHSDSIPEETQRHLRELVGQADQVVTDAQSAQPV